MGDEFNVATVQKSFTGDLDNEEEWKPRTVEELALQGFNFEPRLVAVLLHLDRNTIGLLYNRLFKLLGYAKNISGRVHPVRSPIESLVSEEGNFVLVGEAGHPMPVCPIRCCYALPV